jgi:signal transduction histidine kinase
VHYEGDVQAVWLPVGAAAAVLYLFDLRWLPGAAIADFALGLPLSDWGEVWVNVVETVGNTTEVLVIALAMRRLLGPRSRIERPEDVGRLLVAVALGTAVSASVGALTLRVNGDIASSEMPSLWRTWFLGDTSGGVLLIPLLLVWVGRPVAALGLPAARKLEGLALTASAVALSYVVFSTTHPVTYLLFPPLIWAALRFGQEGGTLVVAITTAAALWATAHDVGPFVQRSIDDEALTTQLFILIAALTALSLGAVVSQRQRGAVDLAAARRREAEHAAAERQKIARDLHDSVSQTLFSMSLQAGIADHELGRMELPPGSRLAGALSEVRTLASSALAEMRGLIFELRPGALAEEGLVAGLVRHAAAVGARAELSVTVDGPAERLPLPLEAEESLYRLVQEAVANAVKHARASRIEVTVERTAHGVRLTVSDDGRGFDPDLSYAGHYGLESMRTRAEELGGRLELTSAPEHGTNVRVEVPGG